jgi:hypothetical protein
MGGFAYQTAESKTYVYQALLVSKAAGVLVSPGL